MPVEEIQSADEESSSDQSKQKFKGIEDLEKHKIDNEEKEKSDYESEYKDDADPSSKDAERQEEEEEDDVEQLQVTED